MSIHLRKKRRGERLSAEDYNQLVDAIHERDIIIPPSGISGLRATPTREGYILKKIPERPAGGGSAGTPLTPWLPYAAPYTGGGDPPADQALKIMIRPGTVNGVWEPATKNIVITVPAECTAGYYVWLEAGLSATGQITSLDYNSGTALPPAIALPPPTPSGAFPATAYDCLFWVTSNETAVDLSNVQQLRTTPLNLVAIQVQSDVNSSFACYFTPDT